MFNYSLNVSGYSMFGDIQIDEQDTNNIYKRVGAKAKAVSGHSDSDGMGSIPASPNARNVPLLLCQERFNEASLPVGDLTIVCIK